MMFDAYIILQNALESIADALKDMGDDVNHIYLQEVIANALDRADKELNDVGTVVRRIRAFRCHPRRCGNDV